MKGRTAPVLTLAAPGTCRGLAAKGKDLVRTVDAGEGNRRAYTVRLH